MRATWRLAWSATPLLLTLGLQLATSCKGEENECPVCQREKCSDLLAECEPNADCACLAKCVAEHGIPGVESCLSVCQLSERPLAFYALEECMATACPDEEDECATPSDYVPPTPPIPPGSTTDPALAGGELADCSFDPSLPFDPEGDVLQLQSEDGLVCLRLERRDDGAGSLANTSWKLLGMWVGPLGGVAHVEAPEDLCYYSSHHNFMDWAHVWTGATRHDLKIAEDGHGGPRTYELFTYEQGPIEGGVCAANTDGTGLLGGGVIELFPVSP